MDPCIQLDRNLRDKEVTLWMLRSIWIGPDRTGQKSNDPKAKLADECVRCGGQRASLNSALQLAHRVVCRVIQQSHVDFLVVNRATSLFSQLAHGK